jgi:hypothetical protein
VTRYKITVFLSAFLLFQVQPLIAKFILPWFGGNLGVWTTCMLFFQVVLLGGYSYAHLVVSKLPGRGQMVTHLVLLFVSLLFLPIIPDEAWKSAAGEDAPIVQILALLAATIGLPYFLLSSTVPLLQEVFRRRAGHTSYRLYSLSNLGSLLALLSYPFVFEPQLKLHTQVAAWSAGYVVFALLCGWCAVGFVRSPRAVETVTEAEPAETATSTHKKPTWGDVLLWLALAACGSSMLLATTNQLCQEVCSIPFLWVVPLSIYLITFIICFDHERWYNPSVFLALLAVSLAAAVYAQVQGEFLGPWVQLAIYSSVLWVTCMVCHGELVRARPKPEYATWFYLIVSAGGALGGVLVGVVAPLVLRDFWEYRIALGASLALAAISSQRGLPSPSNATRSSDWSLLYLGGTLGLTAAGIWAGWSLMFADSSTDPKTGERVIETTRNFYGVLRVKDVRGIGGWQALWHGQTRHGWQFIEHNKRRLPTAYYGHPSGVGIAIDHHPRRSAGDHSLRIGVVGLGCGTIAALGRSGDYFCFYEINPQVVRICDEYFTFRKDSQARSEVVLGDARIRMEQQLADRKPQQFDVLAIDAFTSDAIPMHLLTRECVEVYRRHLKPDGVLCLHLSNRLLDLTGVARGIAADAGCKCVRIDSDRNPDLGLSLASWVLMTTNLDFLDAPDVRNATKPWNDDDPPPIVWSDDYASLWQALKPWQ